MPWRAAICGLLRTSFSASRSRVPPRRSPPAGNIGVVLMAMSPYTVHPVYATMAAATLDEFFPGRVKLCYGMGAPRDLEAAGIIAEQPLRTLREALEISRRLLSGEIIDFKGERYHVAGRRLATGARQVPLWLAASGPRMLELAGEIADGVVISAGTSPAFVRASLDHVRSRREAARPRLSKRRRWYSVRSTRTSALPTIACAAGWLMCCAEGITRAISSLPAPSSTRAHWPTPSRGKIGDASKP